MVVSPQLLHEFAAVDIASDDIRYSRPLERDLDALVARLADDARVVLGSVATGSTSTSWFHGSATACSSRHRLSDAAI